MIELGVTPTLIQPVILCGGSGTRLWPLSREQYPKQLHALNGDLTLLQQTAGRTRGLSDSVEPIVVGNGGHRFMVSEQHAAVGVRPKAILLESCGRGTAPALTLAAVHAVTADGPVLLATRWDNSISEAAAFEKAVGRGAALARDGHIVKFGMPATAPEPGYGYMSTGPGIAGTPQAHYVEAFVEKPDAATAGG